MDGRGIMGLKKASNDSPAWKPAVVNDRPKGSVVDLFCGAGGLTHGFRREGYAVAAGIDIDEDCRFAYEHNNFAAFIRKDIADLSPEDLNGLFYPGEPRILVGCAPCQPFSTYNQKNEDPKWRLVEKFAELVALTLPDVVSMENVPRLLDFQGGTVFSAFEAGLRRADYHVHHEIAYAPDFGVPQQRHRLVLLASRRGPITLDRSMGANASIDVGHAIGALPPLEAGGVDGLDPMHRASGLSKRNLERIRASRPGGTWQLIELVGHPGGGRSDRFPPSRIASTVLDRRKSASVGGSPTPNTRARTSLKSSPSVSLE